MAVYKSKEKTKDGRQWYFRHRKKNNKGKTIYYTSSKFLTKKEAEEEERLFLMRRDNPNRKAFTLIARDFYDYMSKTKKASTVYTYKKDYLKHIEPFFENFDINDIQLYVVKNWRDEMSSKGLSTKYLNKINSQLGLIFDYAIKNYGYDDNPVRKLGPFEQKKDKIIKDEEKVRYITFDEFQKFISVVNDPLWHAFYMFAYYTGCRRGEMVAITWDDINLNTNEITINKTLYEETKGGGTITSTKNNLNRKIKMSATLKEELTNYKKSVESYNDFSNNWYVFGNSLHLAKTTIGRYKKKYFKESGVKEITLHEFRHSHVSLLINEYIKVSKEKNMKVDTAKFFLMMSDRMGHTIEVMQRTYLHMFPTMQDEIVDLLDNL